MKAPPTATERRHLLSRDPDVSTWVKDRSAGTAATQLEHLRIFLERTDLSPAGLIQLAKQDERKFRNVVLDFLHEGQGRGLKTKYVTNQWWSLRSFLVSAGVTLAWNPELRPTEADEEEGASRIVPTPEQVGHIAGATKSARDRMVVLVLASSGVRIGTFATQNGHVDGLRLKSLVDLRLDPEPHFEKRPAMLRVPAHLSKNSKGYYTGLSEAAAEAVLTSLQERKRKGEKLEPDSPLVIPDGRGPAESRVSKDGFAMLVRKSLAARVQSALDTVAPKGTRWTPHVLRAFVSSQLESAEAKGQISRSRREHFLSHSLGSTDSIYNLGRTLSPDKVEELRSSWRRVLPFLEPGASSSRNQWGQTRRAVQFEMLAAFGFSEAEANSVIDDPKADVGQAIQKRLREGKEAESQRIVTVEEARPLLTRGWTVRTAVGINMVLDPPSL